MDDEEALRSAVEEQARALATGDMALFASYATPAALTQFYRTRAVTAADEFKAAGVDISLTPPLSVARFRGRTSFELHGTWERTSTGWKAVALAIPQGSLTSVWWRRLLRRESNPEFSAREDLS